MQKKVMSQELDFAEQQKLTLFRNIKKLESNNSKLKEALGNTVNAIQTQGELDQRQINFLEQLLNDTNN